MYITRYFGNSPDGIAEKLSKKSLPTSTPAATKVVAGLSPMVSPEKEVVAGPKPAEASSTDGSMGLKGLE